LQASASAGTGGGESLAPLLSELGDLRRQSAETHSELAQTRNQLSEAIERAAAARPAYSPEPGDSIPLTGEGQQRLSELERERPELEAELELVRTRATELQETVNTQRRELTEQRSEFAAELRLLRELVEQNGDLFDGLAAVEVVPSPNAHE
jgi:chromosome segregation ATPase